MDFSFIVPKNAEPYPYNEDQEAWLKELETTERKKGRGWLEYDNTFCCLGIACHLFKAIRIEPVAASLGYRFKATELGEEDSSFLPMPLVYRLRLRDKKGSFEWPLRINGAEYRTLVAMNDDIYFEDHSQRERFAFKDIAAYIRHNPWNVFLSEEEAKRRYDGLPLP